MPYRCISLPSLLTPRSTCVSLFKFQLPQELSADDVQIRHSGGSIKILLCGSRTDLAACMPKQTVVRTPLHTSFNG